MEKNNITQNPKQQEQEQEQQQQHPETFNFNNIIKKNLTWIKWNLAPFLDSVSSSKADYLSNNKCSKVWVMLHNSRRKSSG